jgi:hypothetical protein
MNQIKTFNQFMCENNNYTETSWTGDIDGVEKTVTISEVEDYLKDAPIIGIPVKTIKGMCCHLGKTDEETLSRSNASNLDFPIIISKKADGKYNMILDGHHRLLKAINNNVMTINAKVLDLSTAPILFKRMFR